MGFRTCPFSIDARRAWRVSVKVRGLGLPWTCNPCAIVGLVHHQWYMVRARPEQSYKPLENLQESEIYILKDEIQVLLSRNPQKRLKSWVSGSPLKLPVLQSTRAFASLLVCFPVLSGSHTDPIRCSNPIFFIKRWFFFLSIKEYWSVDIDYHISELNSFSLLKKPFPISGCFITFPYPWYFVERSFHLDSAVTALAVQQRLCCQPVFLDTQQSAPRSAGVCIDSLCCTPESNIMVYVTYNSI